YRPGRRRVGAPSQHRVGDGGDQRDADRDQQREHATVEKIGLDRVDEVVHGVTLAIAGVVGEPVVDVCEPVPAGPAAVARPVRPWLAGRTYAVAEIDPARSARLAPAAGSGW